MTDTAPHDHGKNIGSAEYTHTIPRKRAAATIVFTDDRGRVLLCEPSYKEVWEAVGGAVEENESPRNAAAREAKEELGLDIEPGRLLAFDFVPAHDGRTESLICVYDGGTLTKRQTDSITLDPSELRSWAWCTLSQAHERMRPLVARRIEAALKASRCGGVAELESGHPVGSDPTGRPHGSHPSGLLPDRT